MEEPITLAIVGCGQRGQVGTRSQSRILVDLIPESNSTFRAMRGSLTRSLRNAG